MKKRMRLATIVISTMLLLGIFTSMTAAAQESAAMDKQDQTPLYSGTIPVQELNEGRDSEESAALVKNATINMEQAINAALAANPGTKVVKSKLENENGFLVYSVVLDNGIDVKVDAGNGTVLHQEHGTEDQHEEHGRENEEENEHNREND